MEPRTKSKEQIALLSSLSEKYKNMVEAIIAKAETYRLDQFTHQATERLQNFEYHISLGDRSGHLIMKDGHVYKEIAPAYQEAFVELWKSGVLQALNEFKLVPRVCITSHFTEESALLLEIEYVFIVQTNYFTFSQMRNAVINALILNEVFEHFGWHLRDVNLSNFCINKGYAQFFDVGSFIGGVKFNKAQFDHEFFQYCMLFKLLQMSNPNAIYARTFPSGVGSYSQRMKESVEYTAIVNAFKDSIEGDDFLEDIFERMFVENEIKPEYVELLFDNKTEYSWSHYSDGLWNGGNENNRLKRISQLIKEFTPESARVFADIGGNQGYMCYLLSQMGIFDTLINFDMDDGALRAGEIKCQGLGIDFYKMRFSGVVIYSDTPEFDVSAALALTHHLFLIDGNTVFDTLRAIAKKTKYVSFIEFMPLGLYSYGKVLTQVPDWYTQAHFEKQFLRSFKLLHKEVTSYVELDGKQVEHRILYIGEPQIADG